MLTFGFILIMRTMLQFCGLNSVPLGTWSSRRQLVKGLQACLFLRVLVASCLYIVYEMSDLDKSLNCPPGGGLVALYDCSVAPLPVYIQVIFVYQFTTVCNMFNLIKCIVCVEINQYQINHLVLHSSLPGLLIGSWTSDQ